MKTRASSPGRDAIARAFCLMVAACAVTVCSSSFSQTEPSVQEMVEQLKAQPTPQRARGLRNLTVEASANVDTHSPALSLLIQFDFNSAKVLPESQQALLNLAQAMQSVELADIKFAVEGHTDAKGRPEYNFKLSAQRAQAVSAQLASHGVATTRLLAVGKGASDPANTADPLAAENRRVRIVNLN